MSMNNNSSCKQQQCLMERRNRCRQLQRWNKSLLVLLGVEQVCQRLLEHSTLQQSVAPAAPGLSLCFETPLQAVDSPSPTDWDPNESCYFCHERHDLMEQTDLSSPSSSFDCSPSKPATHEEQQERMGPLVPLLPPESINNLGDQWQNGMAAYPLWPILPMYVTDQLAQNSAAFASLGHPMATSGGGLMDGFSCVTTPTERPFYAALGPEAANDQPLDLSLKRKALPRCRDVTEGEQSLKTASAPNLVGNRRSYSKEDLEAAVLDIRSGRLGTRRASVIYGVPRSTLRNKIHKLELACGSTMARGAHRTVGSSQSIMRNSEFSEQGRFESLQASEAAAVPSVSPSEKNHPDQRSGASRTLQELALQVCAKQLNSAFDMRANQRAALNNFAMSNDLMSVAGMDRSFPSVFLGAVGMEAVRSATRNAVVQAVNGACGASRSVTPVGSILQKPIPYIPMSANDGTLVSTDINHFCALDDPNSKKMRRKRGQYRKYDKNALALAVQSVRRGEMSVHKAGSFYGVPHSTLEYKVKERNLLRAKKQAEATAVARSLVNGVAKGSPVREDQSEGLSALVPNVALENTDSPMYCAITLPANVVGNELVAGVMNSAVPSELTEGRHPSTPPNNMHRESNGTICEVSAEPGSMIQWRKMRRKKGVPKKVVMTDSSSCGTDADLVPLTTTD